MKVLKKIVKKYVGGDDSNTNTEGSNDWPTENNKSNNNEEDGDINDSLVEYGKHILPLIIFLMIGMLCILGWLICCFCCCCNCCCCCCKKAGCKIPSFIFIYAFYAFTVVVCIYGLSQSNLILERMADTECSFLIFVDELLDGETKDTKPKWVGIVGIIDILDKIKAKLIDLKRPRIESINSEIITLLDKDTPTTSRNIFLDKIKNAYQSFYDGYSNFRSEYSKTYSIYPVAKYLLDLIASFGKYGTETNEGSPKESFIGIWVEEYKQVSEVAESTLENTKNDFKDVLVTNVDTITGKLDEDKNIVGDFKSSFQGIQDDAAQ